MSTLHVLLPPMARIETAPALRAWLAHGNRLADLPRARAATLRQLFHFAGADIPSAALRHHCHADDAGVGGWLCADPAWVRTEATGARLMAWPITDLDVDEAESFAGALRPLFGDAGAPLAVDTPSAWCAHLVHGAPRASFTDPVDALGVDLLACLPAGEGARVWTRLFTEAQVALHAHPANAARITAGKHPVNALWLWGAGALPGAVETGLQWVASVDDVVRGLAKLGGAVRLEPLPEAIDAAHVAGDALLDLDAPGDRCDVMAWLPHFQRWLRAGAFRAVVATFAGGERFQLRHVHRLRFWRHA